MKKIFLLAVMAVAGISLAVAQPRAIGGRITDGFEVSYEHGLGEKNMLSIDAGFIYNQGTFRVSDGEGHMYRDYFWGYGLEGVVTYDWINPFGADFSKVWDYKGEWNWYMGVGAGVNFTLSPGSVFGYEYNRNQLALGVAGRVGVEYNFWFPLQLSVDWRPIIGPSMYFGHDDKVYVDYYTSGLYFGALALSVRYKF